MSRMRLDCRMGRRVSQAVSKQQVQEPWCGRSIRCEDWGGGSWEGVWILPWQEKGTL